MKTPRLFTPGPTAIPAEVLETAARPLIHHRTEAFRQAHRDAMSGLQYILRTTNPVAILTASGSGAMEAAVVNMTRPGDTVITTELGKFSERWREIAEAYGMKVVTLKAEYGQVVQPAAVERAFMSNPGAAVLFATHSETATGVLQDVEAFAKIARAHGALIGVDAITSAGAHDVRTDDWGLDAVVGGSQKGVMIPPGLGYVAVSERARARMREGRHPVYYFDLLKALASAEKGDTPYTPAITLVLALRTALEMMRAEGIENIIARHDANARATRAAVTAMGLELLAAVPSNATTAVRTPGDSAGAIQKHLEKHYGVKIAGGQGALKGKIVRIGHLGHYDATDMYAVVSALEATLNDLGLLNTFGRGVAALRESYAGGAGKR
ncbi:MAG: alanine--glyoxylate aminotransferase family protein [Candidatus Krumholzibacteria bacterium]|nr:alanine--glyoxylate aminotransferase family protein [Candidatus Krumholzibacteria bacterium]MDH4336165.1 alanine--glyoxylate aminotransferase family protein [Candidatus Krumholzibacteria bacterium]MDH5268806.1 alanine--glyoxylate aminotransferase family protein [Candidatus Krumholzibacteria bacterium]MDH5628069.1 alanine--glyoxylate aminotransferase family protein [Candidatus Krumholzibacteria bacterium]